MNKKVHSTKLTKHNKVYVVHGYYDECGQYREEYFKKFSLERLPEDIRSDMLENLNKGYDITALILPLFRSIFVLLPKERKNKYVQHIDGGEVKNLLDAELASSYPATQIVWVGHNYTNE